MKQIVINIPEEKNAKINKHDDGSISITFETVEHWKLIKDVDDAVNYLLKKKMCADLLEEYRQAKIGSYTKKLAAYRVVVAALTNNEKRHLTTGERWVPIVQFCKPGKEKNCWGSEIVGFIESEGQKFTVVSGYAHDSAYTGLGNFASLDAISSAWATIGFRTVYSQEIAEHISKYFSHLLFEVHYGGVNCDWKWINFN